MKSIFCLAEDEVTDTKEEGLTHHILESCLHRPSNLGGVQVHQTSLEIDVYNFVKYNTNFLTRIGIPEPLIQAIIIEIQVPMKRMLPNTNGCSGSLEKELERPSEIVFLTNC